MANHVINSSSKTGMNDGALSERIQKAVGAFEEHCVKTPPWKGKKTVVYGAGKFGRDLAAALLEEKVAVLGFLDQKGTGQTVIGNLLAHHLQSPQAKRWLEERPVVMIGVFNHFSSLREIATALTRFGFSTVVTPMELYPHLRKPLGWRYWLGTEQDYSGAAAQINQAAALWSDQESKRVFLETLLFRLEFDPQALTTVSDVSFQYADPALPRWREPIQMVDGGAYTGDSLLTLLQQGYHFETIHAFEPDLENFKALRNTVLTFGGESRISLWPCGIGSDVSQRSFLASGGAASSLSDSGTSHITVVALDDVLHHQPVNFIKMDIEGAELAALQGARRLIEKFRPGLAICIYHFARHLWSIPLWVAQLNLGYRFHCRTYSESTFDTVLYAMPE